MENKTTIELLELLNKSPKEGEKGFDEFWASDGIYEKAMKELKSREPFIQILGEDWDTSLPAVWEEIEDLKAEIKKLKRHKHGDKSGDVLIRI